MREYYVYIMANKRNGTIYIGMSNDLIRRVCEHREGILPGFTKTYGCKMLVYYEQGGDVDGAIYREKQLKKWARKWKLTLIEKMNPEWKDLWHEITGEVNNLTLDSRSGRE
jgi:putative endonuclease